MRSRSLPEPLAILALVLAAVASFGERTARADILPFPEDLAGAVLSETVPSAFAPAPFDTRDYGLEWRGAPVEGVRVALEPGSLEWVRVSNVLVLPRARLLVEADGVEAGVVQNGKFSQPLFVRQGEGAAAVPIALISGASNAIRVRIRRAGVALAGDVVVRFRPRASLARPLVYEDPSCSRAGLRALEAGGAAGWMYVGCRLVEEQAGGHLTSSLEAFVFWDGVGDAIEVGGVPTPESAASLWALRLRAEPGSVVLRTIPGRPETEAPVEMKLAYSVPRVFHRGQLGMGIGPYWFTFTSGGKGFQSATLMPTLYASYSISEGVHVVAFDATTLNSQLDTNLGAYLTTTYVSAVDKRLVVDLMLGATSIGFYTPGRYHVALSAPQGLELKVSDFLGKAHSLAAGGFVYPVSGSSYYDMWLRWGTASFFGEVNFISWELDDGGVSYFSRAVGISLAWPFAMPLVRFL